MTYYTHSTEVSEAEFMAEVVRRKNTIQEGKIFFTKKSKTALDKTIFPRYSTPRPYDNKISGVLL